MTDQENQTNEAQQKTDKVGTISYIYDMAFVLKLMATKTNEPLLSFLLELVENESVTLLKNYKRQTFQEEGMRETKPPE